METGNPLFWRRVRIGSGVRLIWFSAAILVASFEPGRSGQSTEIPTEVCLASRQSRSVLGDSVASYISAVKVSRTAFDCRDWVFFDRWVMGSSVHRHISG